MSYWDYDYNRTHEPYNAHSRKLIETLVAEAAPPPFWNPAFPPSTKADGFWGYSTDPIVLLNPHPLAVLDPVPVSIDNLTDAEYNAIIARLKQAVRYAP